MDATDAGGDETGEDGWNRDGRKDLGVAKELREMIWLACEP